MFLGVLNQGFLGATVAELQVEKATLTTNLEQTNADITTLQNKINQLNTKIASATGQPSPTPQPAPTISTGEVSSVANIIAAIEEGTGLPWYIPVAGGGLVLLLLLRR